MKTVAELEARIKELEDAIEWECNFLLNSGNNFRLNELRARAFPPQFEEVEVKRWECKECGQIFKVVKPDYCDCMATVMIELTGIDKRPIPTKVKRREEVLHTGRIVTISGTEVQPFPNRKVFVEWESEK